MTLLSSSLKNEKILELELRKKIYNFVTENAGSHIRELERKSRIPYTTLKYHLHFLAKHGLITEKKRDSRAQYYPNTISSEDTEAIDLLRQKNIRRIILFLITRDSCAHRDLVDFTRLSPSTITWYTNKLIKKEVITKSGVNKKTVYRLSCNKDKIMKILIAYRESFVDDLVNKTIDMWDIS